MPCVTWDGVTWLTDRPLEHTAHLLVLLSQPKGMQVPRDHTGHRQPDIPRRLSTAHAEPQCTQPPGLVSNASHGSGAVAAKPAGRLVHCNKPLQQAEDATYSYTAI